MKLTLLMHTVLLVALAFPCTLFGDELANPAPGAVRRMYALDPNPGSDHARWHQDNVEAILGGRLAPYSTGVDTSSGGFKVLQGREMGMWTGWVKCRNAGTYTLVANRVSSNGMGPWFLFSLWINGRPLATAFRGATASFNVQLNAGFNEIRLIAEGANKHWENYVELLLKRSDSLKEPTLLSPGALWHEDEIEDEDDEDGDWVPATGGKHTAPTSAPRPAPSRTRIDWRDAITDYAP